MSAVMYAGRPPPREGASGLFRLGPNPAITAEGGVNPPLVADGLGTHPQSIGDSAGPAMPLESDRGIAFRGVAGKKSMYRSSVAGVAAVLVPALIVFAICLCGGQ